MKLTALLVTYNHARYIEAAIESALMQETDFDFEVIVSEDCSTDGTREIVRRVTEAHPDRVRVLASEHHRNDNGVIRRGLEAAGGEYVAMLHGDDFWTAKDKLQKQVAFLDDHPECSMCFHNVDVVYEGATTASHPFHQDQPAQRVAIGKPKPLSTVRDVIRGNFIQTSSVVARHEPFRELPDWYDDLTTDEWPLHVLSAERGPIAYLDEVMAAHRVHGTGLWSAQLSQYRRLGDVEAAAAVYEVLNRHLGFAFDEEIGLELADLYERAAYAFYRTGRPGWAGVCAWRALNRRSAAQGLRRWKLAAVLGLVVLGRSGTETGTRLGGPPMIDPVTRRDEQDELTAEVLALRSWNQRLRVDAERFEDIGGAARNLGRLLLSAAWRRARPLPGSSRSTGPRPAVGDSFHPDFRPYAVRRADSTASDRRRVLHAIPNFTTGGSARLVVDLIERLGDEYEQRVIIRETPSVLGYEGVRVDEYPHLTSARPLRQLLKTFRPDFVHVHYVADHLVPSSDLDYRWYIHVFDAAEQAGVRVVENVNIPTEPFRSDVVERYVYVSDHVRRRHARAGDRASVVYPGTDLTHFRTPPGFQHPTDTIGLAYRLQPEKLDDRAIDPILDVLSRRPDAQAIVIGGGLQLGAYKEAAREAGLANRITFTGYVSYADLPAWYSRMALFVAPVHTESFGQVSVIAMGMELPVAGYHVGALEEILGDTQLLAPKGDARALSDVVVELLEDPERRREIGLTNRRRAEERFSVERMIEQYRGIYEELTVDRIAAASARHER